MMTISTLQTDVKEREAMEYVLIKEFACIVEGIGGGYKNTKELHVMKYKKAVEVDDKDDWEAEVEEERKNMEKYDVWRP